MLRWRVRNKSYLAKKKRAIISPLGGYNVNTCFFDGPQAANVMPFAACVIRATPHKERLDALEHRHYNNLTKLRRELAAMEVRKFNQGYVVRLDPKDEVIACLTQLVQQEGITLASVSAIGAANDVTMGVFDTDEKKYYTRRCQGEFEISALVGNITRKDEEPYLHLHITIGNPHTGEVYAGHLNACTISATLEMMVQTWDGAVDRTFSEDIGLNIFQF